MATEGVNFTGLASGLDTQQIIEDLITVDSQPLKRLESQKTSLSAKNDTYATMKTNLLALKDKAFEVKSTATLGALSASSSDEEALTLDVSPSANPGNYSLKVLSLAQAMTLSGDSFEDTDTDLGLSGEFLLNGTGVKVRKTDSLTDIRNSINNAEAGVTATILKVNENDNRLIISAEEQGTDGFTIGNVKTDDILGALGFTDGTKVVREVQNGKVLSGSFESAGSTIGSLYDLSTGISGTVTVRDTDIEIDFSTDTLNSIRDKINNANISGVTAEIETIEEDDQTFYQLAISGTRSFTDDNNILESLGILTGGTTGTYAVFETGTLYTKEDDGDGLVLRPADENTKLEKLGALSGAGEETVTISGIDVDGDVVASTLTIDNNTKVSDVLAAVEEAFGGDVTASLVDGKITVQSTVAGVTDLSVSITANNENGGSLDFGTITNTVVGRDRVVVEGTNARVEVNNIEVSRATNEISDVITGLTLNLKKADEDTILNITVEQDNSAVFEKIDGFVESYNSLINHINQQSEYDEETQTAGPLQGDLTARSTVNQIQQVLQRSVGDGDLAYDQLAEVGIELTTDGTLKINAGTLNDALNEDIDGVMALFTVSRTATDNDISFVYSSTKTNPGTYDVEITRAAEKAEVQSDSINGSIGTAGTVTVTDNLGAALEIEYAADMTIDDISALINSEAQKSYAQIIESDKAFLDDTGTAVTQGTAVGDIQGVEVTDGDTISVYGTNRAGRTYQRTLTLTDSDSHTIGDILEAIEESTDNQVTASIDVDGRIVVQERNTGSTNMSFSFETTVSGLDFGEFDVTQQGRGSVSVNASVDDDNRLSLTHEYYGSEKTFTVSGGSALGIGDDTYAGVDVAGSINGFEGKGSGQSLTASTEDENTRGITIVASLTAEELLAEGTSQGTISLVAGVAEQLYSSLTAFTDPVDGFVQVSIDSIELEIDSLDDRIDIQEQRIEQRREMYVRRFTEMEKALSMLQSTQQQLSAALGTLPQSSIFSS